MKRAMVVMFTALLTVILAAQNPAETRKSVKDMTPAGREQRRAARIAAAGGLVERPNDGTEAKPGVVTTYKRACEEGWAPAPTNAVQRAIWEKVQAEKERGPSHPITIQPPKTKK